MQIRRKLQINAGISATEAALRESEARYRSLFEHMLDGFAYCQMLFDEHGRPDDFIYLAVNDAFGRLTGLKDVIGKRVTQVLPRIKELNPELFEMYGRVASTGTPERFDVDFKPLGLYLSVSVYSPTKGFFVAVFDDISERKQAEERLRASEEKYRTLFESSMDAVLLTAPDGSVFSANKAACEMFGRSEEELCRVGRGAVVDVSDPRLAAALKERSRTGAFRGELTYIRKDGSRFPGEITNVVFPGPDGQLRTSMIIRDITDRKSAEEALRESEERFRLYFKLGLIGMAITSPTKGFIEVNDETCRILGYERGELKRKTWAELTHPDDLTADIGQFNRAMAGEIEGYTIEKRFVRKDGQTVETILSVRAIHHADGSVGDFVVLLQDVGERKKAEERERLEHRETAFANRVLRTFVELEGDALFDKALAVVLEEMASRHGVFGYIPQPGHLICPSLSKMLDACEIEGKCIHYPPEKWKGMWAQALREKRSLYNNEASPVPPGHPIIHNNLAAPILFHGEVVGLLNIANKNGGYTDDDCSMLDRIAARMAPVLYAWIQRKLREDERKAAEEALRRAKDELELRVQERTAELERKNRELQEFAFVAAHDLNEPLRKIQTFGSLLETKSAQRFGEQERDYISRMTAAANRMQDLLAALLNYSRIETKGEKFTRTPLSDVVRDAISDFEVKIRSAGAQVSVGPLPIVWGDPNQLRQMFQNLVGNAVKYRRPDVTAVVKISGAESNGVCRIRVEDNGIGFDEKYLNKIFQPFQRLHGKHEYPGLGIGLAICRKIVDRHRGTIKATSTPGKGSTFIVTLPVNGGIQ